MGDHITNEETLLRFLRYTADFEDSFVLQENLQTQAGFILKGIASILYDESVEEEIVEKIAECMRAIVGNFQNLVENHVPTLLAIASIFLDTYLPEDPSNESMLEYVVGLFIDFEDAILFLVSVLVECAGNDEKFRVVVSFCTLCLTDNENSSKSLMPIFNEVIPTIIDNFGNLSEEDHDNLILLFDENSFRSCPRFQKEFGNLLKKLSLLTRETSDVQEMNRYFDYINSCFETMRSAVVIQFIEEIKEVVHTAISILCTFPKDEWNEDYLGVEDNVYRDIKNLMLVFQGLEPFGKVTYKLLMKEDVVPRLLKSKNWREQSVGVNAILQAGSCFKGKAELKDILERLLLFFDDYNNQHPQVRYSLCMIFGEFCDSVKPFRNIYHKEIVKAIRKFLQDPIGQISAIGFDVAGAFFLDCDEAIAQNYIPIFVQLIIEELQNDESTSREKAIGTLSAIITIGGTSMNPYYSTCIPLLMKMLDSSTPTEILLKVVESLTVAAGFMGSAFDPYWEGLVNMLLEWESMGFKVSDPRLKALNKSWDRLIIGNHEEMRKYIPRFLPRIVNSTSQIGNVDGYSILEDFRQQMENPGDDEFQINIQTDKLEIELETNLACVELCTTILDYLPNVMIDSFPLLYQAVVGEIPFGSFPGVDGILMKLGSALITAMKNVKVPKATIIPGYSGILERFLKITEFDEKFDNICDFIETAETDYINASQLYSILTLVRDKLIEQSEMATVEYDDSVDDKNENAATQILLKFLQIEYDHIIHHIHMFWWYYERQIYMDNVEDDFDEYGKVYVNCYNIFIQLVTCGATGFAFIKNVIPIVLSRVCYPNAGPRQSLCFAVGVIAEEFPDYFLKYIDKAVKDLISLIEDPNSRNEVNSVATDNAVFALGRIIEIHHESIDLEKAVKAYSKGLPTTNDEPKNVYHQVIRFIESKTISKYLLTSKEDKDLLLKKMMQMKLEILEDEVTSLDYVKLLLSEK